MRTWRQNATTNTDRNTGAKRFGVRELRRLTRILASKVQAPKATRKKAAKVKRQQRLPRP